ncbi:peroxidase 30-like [Brachypodium distachyon]|uniref:Peroxidase n=1 Tax=Brachypodium distachyon TaxID=15368 RepID=A0A0Q3G9D9_BRADI|nr:peroxidase 30-like [Brachypodium distachyon]KQK07967.1 hypothetical protein BRADI_2g38685v3 [Brachypodium distachyon]|eukprot:XP_024314242.1 peroxidase 30-like [Brachypodium distachyon]
MSKRNENVSLSVLLASAVVAILLAAQVNVKPAMAGDYTIGMQTKVRDIVQRNRAVAPGLIRLAFHDCWVKGCDGSVLLERADKQAEMDAPQNGGIRGLDLIQAIKDTLSLDDSTVTCADAVVYAAREACNVLSGGNIVYAVDGPGSHKDTNASSMADAGALPGPTASFANLAANFNGKGFTPRDVVVLSGAHAVGLAHRPNFEARLTANANEISQKYRNDVNVISNASPNKTAHNNVRDLDKAETEPGVLDNNYYAANLGKKVLFSSDFALTTDGAALNNMTNFKNDATMWFRLFEDAMARLSRLPAQGADVLQVPRIKCNAPNPAS